MLTKEQFEKVWGLFFLVLAKHSRALSKMDDYIAIENFERNGDMFGEDKKFHARHKGSFKAVSKRYKAEEIALRKEAYNLFIELIALLPNETQIHLSEEYSHGRTIARYDEKDEPFSEYVITAVFDDKVTRIKCRQETPPDDPEYQYHELAVNKLIMVTDKDYGYSPYYSF